MTFSISDKINFYNNFKNFYHQILKNFKFDYNRDQNARDFLQEMMMKKKDYDLEEILKSIKIMIHSKEKILIYGCGPSLENTMKYILKINGNNIFNNSINLCADGATRLLREKSVPVDAIFTDLDGISDVDFLYSKFVIVHAHGDNIDKMQKFKDVIINFKNVVGTTQVEPTKYILNPGGFTDGDRILFFLKSFLKPTHNIFLIGMDFDKIVGKYSKIDKYNNFKASRTKRKKLKYAKFLLEWIQSQIPCPVYNVNSNKSTKKFNNLTLFEFKKFVICSN